MENKLDGNAAAGILQAIFPFDMTLVQATCTGCGATNVLGATAAYMHGMGTIVRCPSCGMCSFASRIPEDATSWICGVCASLK